MNEWYFVVCCLISGLIYNGLAKELKDKGQALILTIPCFIALLLAPLTWD